MDISIFLARVFGIYFIIMGFLLFVKSNYSLQIIRDFYQNPVLVFAIAWITCILGILVVVSHSIWELNWKILITLLGYLTLLKGIMHLYIPKVMAKINAHNKKNRHRLVYGALCLLGFFLVFMSF